MSEPPKAVEWLLRRLVGGRDADAVAGDLRETFEVREGGRPNSRTEFPAADRPQPAQ